MSHQKIVQPIYFGGRIEGKHDEPKWMPYEKYIHTEEAFLGYLAKVWANQNDAPTELPALAEFDFSELLPEYKRFLKSGGKLPMRGLSLEEQWMLAQLTLSAPHLCLLNSAQPEQPISRITRLRKLTAAEIWTEIEKRYTNPYLEELPTEPITLMVYDGAQIAHVVVAWTIWANEIHFGDPWPGRSLLCSENNAAGVRARKSNVIKPGWRITAEEFKRIVFAAILTTYKLIPLTEEERQAAETESTIMDILRQVNRPDSPSIKDIFPGAVMVSELESAVELGQLWRVKVALNRGVDINERSPKGTPLHIAAARGHLEIIRLLVIQGADFLALDSDGKTPAEVAKKNRHLEIARYLRSLKKIV